VQAAAAHAQAAAAKAVYERPASAASASSSLGAYSSAAYKPRSKNVKPTKPPGQLPLTREEKLGRLPPKVYTAFGDFESVEAAADPAIWSVPHHAVLPGRNLPPPNEACTHGFWPGPPALKLGKAVFPAPPEPVDAAKDLRPRVDVFIDNSNVLYSFLNWVRARPDVKVLNKSYGGKGGVTGKDPAASKVKQVKVVTIGGKKVCLDYRALFALIERGRKVERRILVGSSTLWQTLEPAVEWVRPFPRSLLSSSLSRCVLTAHTARRATRSLCFNVCPAPSRPRRLRPSPRSPRPRRRRRRRRRARSGARTARSSSSSRSSPSSRSSRTRASSTSRNRCVVSPRCRPARLGFRSRAEQADHRCLSLRAQAVDELVHLKILETLLDYTPDPLPPPSPRFAAAAAPPSAASAPLDGDAAGAAPAAAAAACPVPSDLSSASTPSRLEKSSTAVSADSVAPVALSIPAPAAAVVDAAEAGGDVEMGGSEEEDAQPARPPEADALEHDEHEQHVEVEQDVTMQPSQASTAASNAESSEHDAATAASAADPSASSPAPGGDRTALNVAAPPPALEMAPSLDPPAPAVSGAAGVPTEAPVVAPAKSRFLPSQGFLSGTVQPAKPIVATPDAASTGEAPAPRPTSGASKFTPAAPKPASAPRPPSRPAQGTTLTPVFAPRLLEPRTRPALVIVTGDANSSEYNPGGFLGCVRRALDRGWDVEVYAFTHGISSLWVGEQQIKVTRDGRRRGELRVVDLAQFGEELVL